MYISGFTFIRNGIKFDYPFLESLRSLLPICDKVVVAVGRSEDATLEAVESLGSPKIIIVQTEWDESLKTGGSILSRQTDIALGHIQGDWGLYLQGDEILHEKDYDAILKAMDRYKDDGGVEGLLFSYFHFYGSYGYIGNSRRWYRREVRAIKPALGIRSWGDAQGFRLAGRKLRVKLVDAFIYHYGWVKPPEVQQLKQKHFNKFWHSDAWIEKQVGLKTEYDYRQGGKLKSFDGTHPSVMSNRIKDQQWNFQYDSSKESRALKEKILDSFEALSGWRIGEYKNYKLL